MTGHDGGSLAKRGNGGIGITLSCLRGTHVEGAWHQHPSAAHAKQQLTNPTRTQTTTKAPLCCIEATSCRPESPKAPRRAEGTAVAHNKLSRPCVTHHPAVKEATVRHSRTAPTQETQQLPPPEVAFHPRTPRALSAARGPLVLTSVRLQVGERGTRLLPGSSGAVL